MDKLKSALAFGGILSRGDIYPIATRFRHHQTKVGEYVQEMHEVASSILFVASGILRILGVDAGGNEITKQFVRENQFCANLESYYTRLPATKAIQSVVGGALHSITFSAFERQMQETPNLFIFFKSICEATLLTKIKDNDFLNFGDSKTKYLELIGRYPNLVQQVPQQYLASYLNISS